MYLRAKLSVDPAALTEITKRKPTKAFAQLLHYMTLGASTPRQETETFSALSILQGMNVALRRVGVTNIVRLSKDDVDFYLDEAGKENDLQEALDSFREQQPAQPLTPFEELHLVVEHSLDGIEYLIDVSIRRTHAVGEHPIQIRVNGVFPEFRVEGQEIAEARETLEQKVDTARHAEFLEQKRTNFERFVIALEEALRESLEVDDIDRRIDQAVLRPKERRDRRSHDEDLYLYDPCLGGYYGWEEATLYLWAWGEFSHSHELDCRECSLVDEQGSTFLEVGSEGLGDSLGILDPSEPLSIPIDGDHSVVRGSLFDADIAPEETTSSWISFDAGDSSGASGSCSSCSSCGGCGGD